MRIATWNVNSIRVRQQRVVAWLRQHAPDVLLMQETKCTDEVFAADEFAGEYRRLGYEVAHHGHDHWNGVAIVSRVGLADVQRGFTGHNRPPYGEARLMSALCGGERVWSIYAPNGRALDDQHYLFKLVWLERLRASVAHVSAHEPGVPVIVAGDFNVAPTDLDIYDPVRWRRRTHASPPERAAIAALLDLGLVDITRTHLPGPGVYTWWSYRPGQFEQNRGLRIDLALCSGDLAERVQQVWIDTHERRGNGPAGTPVSDHAPLVLDLRSELGATARR